MNSFPIDLQFKLLKNGLPEIMVMAKVKNEKEMSDNHNWAIIAAL